MKSVKQYILEKLKVGVRNTTEYTVFPKTREELKQMINDEISKSLKRIDNKEKSIYQLELEIKEEKSKVENLTCLLSEVKGKE